MSKLIMKSTSTLQAGPSVPRKHLSRLPQAPASLLVQLPPDELEKFKTSRSVGDVDAGLDSLQVGSSDLHLLATSIHQRREREARVFVWQQRLIDADESLDRNDLKRALTQLSLSAWLQVLQERHLNNVCTYPTCSRKPKKPHISARDTILPLDAPRYRISLSNQTIKRDERDDAGGENGYCSKACWRRGEWVSRWVLEGNLASQQEKKKRSVQAKEEFGSVLNAKSDGLGGQVDEGGRWERLIDEENWDKVELIEDLEDQGTVDRLSDDESICFVKADAADVNSMAIPSKLQSPETAPVAEETQVTPFKDDLNNFSSMLDSLEIVERPPGHLLPVREEATKQPSRPRRIRLVDPATKKSVDKEDEENIHAELSDVDSDDMDVLGELSLRSGGNDGDDVVSSILRSSRHSKSVQDDQDEIVHVSEEQRKKDQEEDDLFSQAWHARDEERAKGSWVE